MKSIVFFALSLLCLTAFSHAGYAGTLSGKGHLQGGETRSGEDQDDRGQEMRKSPTPGRTSTPTRSWSTRTAR